MGDTRFGPGLVADGGAARDGAVGGGDVAFVTVHPEKLAAEIEG